MDTDTRTPEQFQRDQARMDADIKTWLSMPTTEKAHLQASFTYALATTDEFTARANQEELMGNQRPIASAEDIVIVWGVDGAAIFPSALLPQEQWKTAAFPVTTLGVTSYAFVLAMADRNRERQRLAAAGEARPRG